jgi:hypothetical protein
MLERRDQLNLLDECVQSVAILLAILFIAPD